MMPNLPNRFPLAAMLIALSTLVQAQPDCLPPGSFSATLAGDESASLPFNGNGAPLFLDLDFTFIDVSDQASWAADLAVSLTSPNGQCVQFGGYNFSLDTNCTYLGNYALFWPSDWNTNVAGIYSTSVDLSAQGLSGNGTWMVTLTNGYGSLPGDCAYDLAWSFTCQLDTTPPVATLINCPGDATLVNECPDGIGFSPDFLGFPQAQVSDDLCPDPTTTIEFADVITMDCAATADDAQPEGSFTMVRTFTLQAEDCDGNVSNDQCVQTITHVDLTAPTLDVTCPSDVEVVLNADCSISPSALSPASLGAPLNNASDACDSHVRIDVDFYDGTAIPNANDPGFSFDRFWNIEAKDDCGNSNLLFCTQPIVVDAGGCVPGCTYPGALNYNPAATSENGSCTFDSFTPQYGCTNQEACNYETAATFDDGSCQVPGLCEDCMDGAVISLDADGDGVCDADEVAGCTDFTACNFSPTATDDNGTCKFLDACGICDGQGAVLDCGCSGIPAGDCNCNGDQLDALGICGGACDADVDGDGICDSEEVGCTYPDAMNFDTQALADNGTCSFELVNPCPTDVDGDGTTDTQDLILLLGSFSLVCE